MARSANGTVGASGQPEPGDDKGGLLGGNGADDTRPDDNGGVLAGQGADDTQPDDHGGLVGGHGADDTAPDDHGGAALASADDPASHEHHNFAYTDTSTHTSGGDDGVAYTGPVNYLQHQYIWGGHDGRAVSTGVGNVFIHGGDGDDAIAVSSGNNVLDGGDGSNFLVGGHGDDGGSDTFFVDVRGGQTVWDTLVNFHHDDAVTVWGYKGGTSSMTWSENEGADGFKGATLHVETNGSGTGVNASVTFAGLTVSDAQSKLGMSAGNVGGNDYLYLRNNG